MGCAWSHVGGAAGADGAGKVVGAAACADADSRGGGERGGGVGPHRAVSQSTTSPIVLHATSADPRQRRMQHQPGVVSAERRCAAGRIFSPLARAVFSPNL